MCNELFPKHMVQVDHVNPVVGEEGFQTWDIYIQRLFCEATNLQVLCSFCHLAKTGRQRKKKQ